MSVPFLRELILTVMAAVFAIVLHELAHGVAAWALGDDTAKRLGRLSLNPLRHVDRFGTVLLPGLLAMVQLLTIRHIAFMFAFAKPVPVNAARFRHPRQDMALVAAAGPIANFVLAWLAAVAGHAADGVTGDLGVLLDQFLSDFILVNLALGLFNLLPIPPLDGGRIVVGVLPPFLALRWARVERAGVAIVLLTAFLLPPLLQEFGITFDPVGDALQTAIPRAEELVMRLAGYDA